MAKALVVTFNRLALRMLGCYGSDWVETPNFDRLAAQSMVFDRHFAENIAPDADNHAWWSGCYQFPRQNAQQPNRQKVMEILNFAGIRTTLIAESTSDSAKTTHSAGFQHMIGVTGSDGLGVLPTETPFARLVDQSVEELQRHKEQGAPSWLIWLHSPGVPSPWIPPRDFAELYLDLEEETDGDGNSEEESAIDLSEEALEELILAVASLNSPNADPTQMSDLEWRLSRCVYAGYLSMIDIQLGKLLDAIEKLFTDESLLLILTASKGESLRATSAEPEYCSQLGDEIVHTPLICQILDRKIAGRAQSLVSSVDLAPTLLEWFNVFANSLPLEGRSLIPEIRNEFPQHRDYICLGNGKGSYGIMTPELYFIRAEQVPTGLNKYLYVKPDDLWNIQNVVEQSPDDAGILEQTLDHFIQQARKQCPLELPEIIQTEMSN